MKATNTMHQHKLANYEEDHWSKAETNWQLLKKADEGKRGRN